MSDLRKHIVDRLIESVPVLLIVSGVVVFALGVAGGIHYGGWLPIPDKEGRIAAAIAGALAVGLGVWLSNPRGASVPAARDYGITIDHPRSGDALHVVDVRGAIKKKLPDGYALHAFRIYPHEDRFVSMAQARVDVENGTWEARDCNIGGEPGDSRAIAAYLVGPAGKVLIDYFAEAAAVHNASVKELPDKSRIPYLPPIKARTPDMVECARVSVKRK